MLVGDQKNILPVIGDSLISIFFKFLTVFLLLALAIILALDRYCLIRFDDLLRFDLSPFDNFLGLPYMNFTLRFIGMYFRIVYLFISPMRPFRYFINLVIIFRIFFSYSFYFPSVDDPETTF